MSGDLFRLDDAAPWPERLGPGTVHLHAFARADAPAILAAIDAVERRAPFRHMITPGGFTMSVAMTNCGAQGWVSDANGYRYSPVDPQSGEPWPAMPAMLQALAREAAAQAGFPGFEPDACLINRYVPGARMSLHQDRDERNLAAPIVSVSLGLPAIFLLGGRTRRDPQQRILLEHGDGIVWGGGDRLRYHGVQPVKDGRHALLGAVRLNLTFRCSV